MALPIVQKVASALSKVSDVVGPNDSLSPPPGNRRLFGPRTGLDVRPLAELEAHQAQKAKDAAPLVDELSGSLAHAVSPTTFDPASVTVIFVLGGPGAGKGTQCGRLVADFGFVHLSAGDLLRAEQNRPGSQYGQLIREYIKEGKVVPMEITIKLLENTMQDAIQAKGSGMFLIDGFPRKMDQALEFDKTVCPSSLVLFLVCPESILLTRLLERGKTSGRDDDNEKSIKKRFRTFIDTSMPVVDYYRGLDKVLEVDSSQSIEAVYAELVQGLQSKLDLVLSSRGTSTTSI